jgi:HK97 family phage major capsid protein
MNSTVTKAEVRKFSLSRALLRPNEGGLERDISAQLSRQTNLGTGVGEMLIPWEVLTRDVDSSGFTGTGDTVDPITVALRPHSMLAGAGANIRDGAYNDVPMPVVTTGATAEWLASVGDATKSDLVFGEKVLQPKRVHVFTKISRQWLLQGGSEAEPMLREELVRAVAQLIDTAGIAGSGASNQPTGILSAASVGSVTFGAAATVAKLADFEAAVGTANADTPSSRLAWVINSATRAKWRTIPKVSGGGAMLLGDDNRAIGHPAFATNAAGAGNKAVFGDFSQLVVHFFAPIGVLMNPYTQAKDGFVEVHVFAYVDIGVRRPTAFAKSSDSAAQ